MQGLFLEDLSLGQSAELVRTVAEADLVTFAEVTGDANPVHLDADYAATTSFGERIAHGIGDEVTARVTVTAIDEAKARVTLATTCLVRGKTVVDGEAVIMVPRKAAA
jgi:3-hydroxybutyryl-CoA dehydratase